MPSCRCLRSDMGNFCRSRARAAAPFAVPATAYNDHRENGVTRQLLARIPRFVVSRHRLRTRRQNVLHSSDNGDETSKNHSFRWSYFGPCIHDDTIGCFRLDRHRDPKSVHVLRQRGLVRDIRHQNVEGRLENGPQRGSGGVGGGAE